MFKKSNLIKYYNLNLISFFCCLIIPLIISGPFLPDLVLSLLVIWFIAYSIKNKSSKNIQKIYRNNFFFFFIIFCIICIFSSLLSDDIWLSFESSLFYFRIGIFALLISFLINQKTKVFEYFYYSFLITFSILIFDGNIQYFTGENLFGFKISANRVSSFFHDELILGSYLSRLYPLFFAIFIIKPKKNIIETIFVSILFILTDILIFFSGERSAFFLFNLCSIFIIIFITQYKYLRLTIFLISLSIIMIITLTNQNFFNRYVKSPIEGIGLNKNSQEIKFFSHSHDFLYKTSWNMFMDKPFLGHGPKLFRIKCNDEKYRSNKTNRCHTHPHNFYIQLLAETGIIGFLFLFGVLIYFCFIVFKHLIKKILYKHQFLSDYQICLLGGLLITIWPFVPNGNFFNNHLMIMYSLQIGFFKHKINIKDFKKLDNFLNKLNYSSIFKRLEK